MWGEIFKEGLKIIGSNLLKGGSDDGGGSGRDFTPVSFDEYEMGMFRPEGSSKVEGPEVSNYMQYKKFWDDRLLQYLMQSRQS